MALSQSQTIHVVLPHTQVVAEKYSTGATVVSKEFLFQFSEDSLFLDLPMEGKLLESGWKVIPMYPPHVRRQVNLCSSCE